MIWKADFKTQDFIKQYTICNMLISVWSRKLNLEASLNILETLL